MPTRHYFEENHLQYLRTLEQPVHEVDNEDFEDDAKSNVHATPYSTKFSHML